MNKLKTLRESRNLTQVDLAEISGVPQSTISRIESGFFKKGPSIDNVVKLAKALGVPVAELLEDDEDSKET